MSNNVHDRLVNLLRELSDINEIRSNTSNNTYNINFYENYYNNSDLRNFREGNRNDTNIENTNLEDTNISFLSSSNRNNNTNNDENVRNSSESNRPSTDNQTSMDNIQRVTTHIIPLTGINRTGEFMNNENLTNEISNIISSNIRDIIRNRGNLDTNISIPPITSNISELRGISTLVNLNLGVNNEEEHPLPINILTEKTEVFIIDDNLADETKCPICNEKYEVNSICRKNKLCGHFFHLNCIDQWYSEKNICPECNQKIE